MEASTTTLPSSGSLEIKDLYQNEAGWLRSIPENFRDIELSKCIDLPQGLLDFSRDYISRFPFGSLYFFGQWGSGKTTLAFAIIREIMRHMKGNFWPRYFTGKELDNRLLKAIQGEGGDEDCLVDLSEIDLLFLDDIDKVTATPRFKSQFFEIINRRLVKNKPTIITSNSEPTELGVVFDGAVISRLSDTKKWKIIQFPSRDLRKLDVIRF